jgi:hypothetical protein
VKGLLAVVVAVVTAACGGKTPAPTHPETGSAASAGSGSAAPPPVVVALTEQECDQLLDHTIDIEYARRAPDQRPDPKEQQAVRESIRDKFLAECRTLKRGLYECAIAAKTTAEMEACDQASRSSSTSNSSVAPGGMTPAAPRSP